MRVLLAGAGIGVVFAILDAVLNANPLAQRLYAVYKPVARDSVNAPLGLAFDLAAGVVMAWLFVLLAPALPGGPVLKGIAFGGMAWFFRVAMGAASQAVMFRVSGSMLAYMLLSGLVEMTALGVLCGLALGAGVTPGTAAALP